MLNFLRTELSAHRTVPADSSELSPSLRRAHTDVQAGGADTPRTTAELTPRPPFRAGGTKPIASAIKLARPHQPRASTRTAVALAWGESVLKRPYPLNVFGDAYDHSCYCARSDEYRYLMTGSPRARSHLVTGSGARGVGAGVWASPPLARVRWAALPGLNERAAVMTSLEK